MSSFRSRRRGMLVVAGAALLLTVSACEDTTPKPAERTAVEQAVNGYLQRLADAYTNMDTRVLNGLAAKGEIASVQGVLRKLGSTGDRIEASLLRVEFEKMEIFRVVNATVKTLEVWDVHRYDAFTGKEKGHNPGTIQHAVIQLRLIDGSWIVTARRVLETQGGTRWNVTTPTAAAGGTDAE